jgi:hypothetical protein
VTEVAVEALPAEIAKKVEQSNRDVPRTVDYFATNETIWHSLPDGVQRVEIKVLNEGERRSYLNKTNSDVTMNARTKELKMRSQAGDDLHVLLETSIVGWDVVKNGEPFPFSPQNLKHALNTWPPQVWDGVAKAVRKANPWLMGTEDDLDALREEKREIEERIAVIEAEAAKSV